MSFKKGLSMSMECLRNLICIIKSLTGCMDKTKKGYQSESIEDCVKVGTVFYKHGFYVEYRC